MAASFTGLRDSAAEQNLHEDDHKVLIDDEVDIGGSSSCNDCSRGGTSV